MSLDEGVGEIITALKNSGVWDNTLLVVTSDNGGGHGEAGGDNRPLRGRKGSVHEGGIRVPTLVSFPRQNYDIGIDPFYYSVVDLFPTFLEAAGIDSERYPDLHLDGHSILPLRADRSARVQDEIVVQITNERGVSALISPPYKYVWDPRNAWFEQESLYNLESDPGEKMNLIDPGLQEIEPLRQSLKRLRDDVAPTILKQSARVPDGFIIPDVINPSMLQQANQWTGWGNPSLWSVKLEGLSSKKILALGVALGVGIGGCCIALLWLFGRLRTRQSNP